MLYVADLWLRARPGLRISGEPPVPLRVTEKAPPGTISSVTAAPRRAGERAAYDQWRAGFRSFSFPNDFSRAEGDEGVRVWREPDARAGVHLHEVLVAKALAVIGNPSLGGGSSSVDVTGGAGAEVGTAAEESAIGTI